MNKFYCLVLLLFCNLHVFAQKLVVVIWAATNDQKVGLGCEKNFEYIDAWTDELATCLQLKKVPYYLKDENFTKKNAEAQLNEILANISSKDRLIFYFSGHGLPYEGNNKDFYEWQNLFLSNNFGTENKEKHCLNFKYIDQLFRNRNPYFLLSIAESCNEKISNSSQNITFRASKICNAYKSLFSQQRRIIVSSSRRGDFAYINDQDGGAFKLALQSALDDQIVKNSPSWDDLLSTTRLRTSQISRKIKINGKPAPIQIPYFEIH